MNALASDQARRIAAIVDRTPSLRGRVTAGLYVGETGASPRRRMGADHLIENRDVLREHPPDILLTNYKMLDLPAHGGRSTFHSGGTTPAGCCVFWWWTSCTRYDGAQGTDLACLIRRLRARLQADDGLVCAGTSATIGGGEDRTAILDYVSEVFHQPFLAGRRGRRGATGDRRISARCHHQRIPRAAAGPRERMAPGRYPSADEYIRAQHELFFGEPPGGGLESPEWRLALGEKLREHAAFVNLLRVLDGSRPTPVASVLERLRRSLPVAGIREAEMCPEVPLRADLRGAAARGRGTGCAGTTIAEREAAPVGAGVAPHGVQRVRGGGKRSRIRNPVQGRQAMGRCWLRATGIAFDSRARTARTRTRPAVVAGGGARCAVRRSWGRPYVGPVHRIRYADDLKPDEDSVHLPLIQCRECHAHRLGVREACRGATR